MVETVYAILGYHVVKENYQQRHNFLLGGRP